jgi:hypothetical protein
MKLRTTLFALLVVAATACNKKPETASTTTPADTSAVMANDVEGMAAAPAPEMAASVEGRPAPKSETAQAAIRAQWDAAAAAEKKFLGSPKLLKWIDGLKSSTDEDGFDQPGKLTDAQFKGLPFQEKFCYYLFHPEMASQNCSMAFFDAGLVEGISGSLPYESERYASERQFQAMEGKKDDVRAWIVKSIAANKAVSVDMLHAVVAFKATSAIQPLIDLYNSQATKDDLILSAFVEMMRNAEFAKWTQSDVAAEMGKEMGGDFGGEMRDFAPLTEANVQSIIAIAKEFAAI